MTIARWHPQEGPSSKKIFNSCRCSLGMPKKNRTLRIRETFKPKGRQPRKAGYLRAQSRQTRSPRSDTQRSLSEIQNKSRQKPSKMKVISWTRWRRKEKIRKRVDRRRTRTSSNRSMSFLPICSNSSSACSLRSMMIYSSFISLRGRRTMGSPGQAQARSRFTTPPGTST